MHRLIIICIFCLSITSKTIASENYSILNGVDLSYDWLSSKNVSGNIINIDGQHLLKPHSFYYNFEQVISKINLTSLGFGYSYKSGFNWVGGGLSSSSNKPYTKLSLIDYDIFYAFRLFKNITDYSEDNKGFKKPYYTRLYFGIDYSTKRILLPGYPLPIIRYEYSIPNLQLIIGFPLTYINAKLSNKQSIEFKYTPILDLLLSYNIQINEYNKISLLFEMEDKRYKVTNIMERYNSDKMNLFVEYYKLKAKYTLTLGDNINITPTIGFLINGKYYIDKSFNINPSNKKTFGMGIIAGLDLSINF